MRVRPLAFAIMASLMLSPVAFAANMTPAAQCTSLEHQFDQSASQHKSAAKYNTAVQLRADGSKLCASGKTTEGIQKLTQALHDIGVKPKA